MINNIAAKYKGVQKGIGEIMHYIDKDSISGEAPVGDVPVKIGGEGTEMTSISEKLIR